jgi:two-component system, NtrC family, sensor histidine kinase HydH
VKAHQGSIVVHSQPGEGAEFLVSLPGLREERPAGPPTPVPAEEERVTDRKRRRALAEERLRGRKKRKKQQA